MIDDKFGPRGASFEAEFRKRVLNAKLEAFYQGQKKSAKFKLLNLESLDSDPHRQIDVSQGKFFNALETDLMPRKFTYIIAELDNEGNIIRANRSIIYMEEAVENLNKAVENSTEFKRADFFLTSYVVNNEELKIIKSGQNKTYFEIMKEFKKKNLKIISSYFEIKSIDLNTPLNVSRALEHVTKHIETFGSSLKATLDEFNLDLAKNGNINVIMREFYHKSLNAAAKHPAINSFSYFAKEQHTAVFTLKNLNGQFRLASKVAAEMIRGIGSIDRMRVTTRYKFTPLDIADPSATPEIRRATQFLQEIKRLLPQILAKI